MLRESDRTVAEPIDTSKPTPYYLTATYSLVGTQEEAVAKSEELDEAAAKLGLHAEGGSLNAMLDSDVIPGSSLDSELKERRRG